MKLTYTAANTRITFECEVANEKAAFEQLAYLQELFEETACGCCQSSDIRPDVREADGNKFFNLKCRACSARLDFGQTRTGNHLFAKRRDDDKKPLPCRGWYIYQPTAAASGQTAAPRTSTPTPTSPTTTNTTEATETALARITAAKHAGTLHQVGEQIGRDIAEGRIPRAAKPKLTAAYERRARELSGLNGNGTKSNRDRITAEFA